MNKPQWIYGEKRLEMFAKKWDVSKLKAAQILMDVNRAEEFFEWVNADLFLNNYIVSKRREQKETNK